MISNRRIQKRPLTFDGVSLSCEHGLKVYLVNGTEIRNHMDSDFFTGNGRVFPFIPTNEIWIDSSAPQEEVHFLIENECVLAESLKNGKDIDRSCAHAQRVESSSRRLEKSTTSKNWRRPTGEYCEHGLEIIIVDGTHVRDEWDSVFIQGGHCLRYDFVPKGEIWIEASLPEDERPFVIFHECYEFEKQKIGWSYDRAHAAAKRAENKMRRGER